MSRALAWLKDAGEVLVGGGVAYWTHHVMHGIWHRVGRLKKRRKR